jgi:hypothetical protein
VPIIFRHGFDTPFPRRRTPKQSRQNGCHARFVTELEPFGSNRLPLAPKPCPLAVVSFRGRQ